MLDVRITGYVVPLAEQPQASLTPVIAVSNVADEDAVITGIIRIYRESTGLLIYDSQLAVTQLEYHTNSNIAALTPFDPPAPADDDYFIKADLVATSYLPGPPLSVTLGAWHFDIKTPPMGAAPAGHHVTHEDGGSDEIDATGLEGAGGGGVSDHGALTGLADDDHPQYRLRHEILIETDLLNHVSTDAALPWYSAGRNGGSMAAITGTSLHPGVHRLSSSASADSGRFFSLGYDDGILIAGGERCECSHRPKRLTNITRHCGFHETLSVTDPVDGVWIWQDPATGIIYGRTRSNSVGSTTGTGFQLVIDTWYLELIVINSDASRVDFYCYNDAGAELWHDFLTTNIPTATGRELAHSLVVTHSSTNAYALDDLDRLSVLIPDRRPDV